MNGREMVKDIADFVKANRLEDLELQDFEDFTFSFYFNEEHTDEIEYTFDPVHWTETIKHLKWGGEDDGYILEEQVLTREEALRLRFPNGEVIKQNYSDSTITTIDKLNKKDWRDEYVSKGTR